MRSLIAVGSMLAVSGVVLAQNNFPPPPAPAGNPVTQDKALLGMALFWEEQLSSNDSVSCGTCHQFRNGGVDPRAAGSIHPGPDNAFGTADDIHGSPGVPAQSGNRQFVANANFGYTAQVTPRRAPSVVNAGYQSMLFYDGRAEASVDFRDPITNQVVLTGNVALENLVLQPPLNPVEMGHPGRTWTDVATKIAAARPLVLASNLPARLATFVNGRDYPAMFQQAFGSPGVTPTRIVMAIASYIRTLNSDQTPYDLHLAGNYYLTPQEQQGISIFRTPQGNAVSCSTCHGDFEPRVRVEGPIAGQMATLGGNGPYSAPTPTRLLFHNVGVRPTNDDIGRQAISNLAGDAGKFRIPSLRNVTLAAPYYHNGIMPTLSDVIDFYDRGGDFHTHQSPGLTVRNFTTADKAALLAALALLTDQRVATGSAPFDRPTLGSENGNVPTTVGTAPTLPSGTAHIVAPVPPMLGEPSFTIRLTGVAPNSLAMILYDTVSVPTGMQFQGLQFYVGLSANLAAFPVGAATSQGYNINSAAVTFPITNNPALVGLRLYSQWLFTEPSTPTGLATSDALTLTVR